MTDDQGRGSDSPAQLKKGTTAEKGVSLPRISSETLSTWRPQVLQKVRGKTSR